MPKYRIDLHSDYTFRVRLNIDAKNPKEALEKAEAIRDETSFMEEGKILHTHDFDIDDWKPSRVEYVKPPEDGSDYAESRTLYIWKVGETPTIN